MPKQKPKRELPRWTIYLLMVLHVAIAYLFLSLFSDIGRVLYEGWGSGTALYLAAGQAIVFGFQYLYWQLQRFLLRHPDQPRHTIWALRAILFAGILHGTITMGVSALLATNTGAQLVVVLVILLNLLTTSIIHRQPRAAKRKRSAQASNEELFEMRTRLEDMDYHGEKEQDAVSDDGELVNLR